MVSFKKPNFASPVYSILHHFLYPILEVFAYPKIIFFWFLLKIILFLFSSIIWVYNSFHFSPCGHQTNNLKTLFSLNSIAIFVEYQLTIYVKIYFHNFYSILCTYPTFIYAALILKIRNVKTFFFFFNNCLVFSWIM